MSLSYVTQCKDCGEHMEGDGYTSVLYCPNTEEDTSYMEPDAGPVYCNFKDGEDILDMKPHWTDPHILFDENEGKFIAYDEAGLEHSRWDSHNEARDALVIYAAVELENVKMKNKGHVHAELMAQYAEDAREHEEPWKLWEIKGDDGVWKSCYTHPVWSNTTEYRRKPKTHTVNGVEIPDLRIKPIPGQVYLYPDPSSEDLVQTTTHGRHPESDSHRMANNLCYKISTEGKQAAILHSKAWLGLVQQQSS